MIEVEIIDSRTVSVSDGDRIFVGSAKFTVGTTPDGLISITNTGDGTYFAAPFSQWKIKGDFQPDLVSTALELDKVVRR